MDTFNFIMFVEICLLYTLHYVVDIILLGRFIEKQVECLAALCHTYVEVLFGGQSSSYVQTTLLVFLCCEATGG